MRKKEGSSLQTFTYTNLRGQSVTFGGSPPYIFEKVKGMGAVDLDIAQDAGAYQQGSTIYRLQRGERKLTLHFHVDGRPRMQGLTAGKPSAADTAAGVGAGRTMYEYRQRLLGVLSPRNALNEETGAYARLTYANDYGSWWTWAIPEGTSYEKRLTECMVSCPVTFRCPSPFWFSMSQSTMTLEMSSKAFRVPFRLPFSLGNRKFSGTANNTGHADAPLTVEIQGTGEMPTLVNHSTGARLSVALPIPSGEVLRIHTDSENLSVTLRRRDGTTQNAYGYLSVDSALSEFVLRPGANEIEYQPSEPSLGSKVRLTWYSRLEGV